MKTGFLAGYIVSMLLASTILLVIGQAPNKTSARMP